jgi:hypothetical protein
MENTAYLLRNADVKLVFRLSVEDERGFAVLRG